MEDMKKKRSEVQGDGTRIPGKKTRSKKARSNDKDDPELEEFLTIINRLQAGFNYLQKKGGNSATTAACKDQAAVVAPGATDSGSWNLAFELDDFNQIEDGRPQNDDVVVRFDLNADPDSDPVPDQKLG